MSHHLILYKNKDILNVALEREHTCFHMSRAVHRSDWALRMGPFPTSHVLAAVPFLLLTVMLALLGYHSHRPGVF